MTSHFSPSTLFYLSEEQPHVRTAQVLPNLAPITDFQLLQRDSSTDIVACSGGFKSGSLRIVRSGVGVDAIAEIGDVPGITGLWTFPGNIVVASFIERTVVYQCDLEKVEIRDITGWNGIDGSQPTIAMQILGSKIAHISKSAAKIIDPLTSYSDSTTVDGVISGAAFVDDYLILAIVNRLILMSASLEELASVNLPHEIACICTYQNLVFVGLWDECKVVIFSLPHLTKVGETASLSGGIPRSIHLCNLEGIELPVLFIGMADGTLYNYYLQGTTLTDQKTSVLGTQPVSLYPLRKGLFAVSSHPSMIYGSANKVIISGVNVASPTALAVCMKSQDAMEEDDDEDEIIAFATDDRLIYGVLDQLMSTHVQTLELHETARRLTIMSPVAGVIGLITLRTEIESFTGDEIINCFVKIVDMALFEVVDAYALEDNEMAECITSGIFDGVEYLIVGTGYASAEREEYMKGRVLVFEVSGSSTKKLSLVLQHELLGGVYAAEVVEGKLVCAVNSIVSLFVLLTICFANTQCRYVCVQFF